MWFIIDWFMSAAHDYYILRLQYVKDYSIILNQVDFNDTMSQYSLRLVSFLSWNSTWLDIIAVIRHMWFIIDWFMSAAHDYYFLRLQYVKYYWIILNQVDFSDTKSQFSQRLVSF